MSNKEFEEWFDELVKDRGFNLNITGDDVEKAWNHQQSKLDAKDELLKEAIAMLLEDCPEVADSYDLATCDRCQFLNKPEIMQLRGKE